MSHALLTLALLLGTAADASAPGDAERLAAAGFPAGGPTLAEFLRQRSRLEVDVPALTALTDELASPDPRVGARAAAALVMRGPAALPVLRRAVNDLGDPTRSARAERCCQLIEGPEANLLVAAVVRQVAKHPPAGAVEALLGYLPAADSEAVLSEVARALTALAFADGKPAAALVEALGDRSPLRRAVACSALARPDQPAQHDKLRPLLRDPKPQVRLRAALALVAASDPEAVPVLIDLLGELPAPDWHQAEDALRQLAGPWSPAPEIRGEDDIARRIRRDVWAVWWKHTEGPALLAEFRQRTLSPADKARAEALIGKLGDEDFDVRQKAADDLVALGTRALVVLRPATRHRDLERSRRAQECIRRIGDEARPLPPEAIRLLRLRKPAGALAALLDFLPHAEGEADEALFAELHASLPILGVPDGAADPLLLRALDDKNLQVRLLAAEALLKGGGAKLRPTVRRLLVDADPVVRLRGALVLADALDREAVPVLIESLADEPTEFHGRARDVLERLAGETAPEVEAADDAEGRKKLKDAWLAWWKTAGPGVELVAEPPSLGYTLLVEVPENGDGRVREIGRDGKERWSIGGLKDPIDAHIVGNRVLIGEAGPNRVSERDFKGNVLWQKEMPDTVVNVQRLPGGNTFVAMDAGFAELDREGKVVWQLAYKDVDAGYKMPDGVIACLTRDNRVVRLQANGKELSSYKCKRDDDPVGGIDGLPGGRVLVAQPTDNSVAEMDAQGNVVWQAAAPAISSATRLSTGRTLIASQDGKRVVELDRSGRVVWEFKSEMGVVRARRR